MTEQPPFSGRISKTAWMAAPETQRVMAALQDEGGEARFVGGCVRDTLVNRKVMDIDIATPLKPDAVIARLERHKIRYAPTGLKHGTVTAIVEGRPFEITTLRIDANTFGRHADVLFTDDWKKDAARRDFTINAIFCTIEGDIYDPYNGVEDLRRGRVAFVGDPERRIQEDILRILRFFRFYAHFGKGMPDPAGLRAVSKLAHLLPRLSAERIRQETLKLLEAPACAAVWRIMLEQGVVTHFLPEATNIRALERLVALEEKYESESYPLRRLAALLIVTPDGVRHIAAALRLSNAEGVQLLQMVRAEDEISTMMDHAAVRQLVYHVGNDMARSLLLLAAARSGEENDLPALYGWATTFRAPRFPLVGEDVLKLGCPPGPEVGEALKALEDWWLDEDFRPGRRESLARLKEFLGPES